MDHTVRLFEFPVAYDAIICSYTGNREIFIIIYRVLIVNLVG